MGEFSALLAICAGNLLVTGIFHSQRPVTRSFGVFVDLRQRKQFSKQWWVWWFEMPSLSFWRHCNALCVIHNQNKLQNDSRLSTKYHYFPLVWCIDEKQSIKVPWFMEYWYPINGSNLFECHDLIQVQIITLILSILFYVMFNTNIDVTNRQEISLFCNILFIFNSYIITWQMDTLKGICIGLAD